MRQLPFGAGTLESALFLRDQNGDPFARRSLDPEGVALSSHGFFVASEGESKAGVPPFVAEFDRAGKMRRPAELPPRFGVEPQAEGARFVTRVEGSRSNVIGLPLERVEPLLVTRYDPGVELVVKTVRFEPDRVKIEFVQLTSPDGAENPVTSITVKWPAPISKTLSERTLIEGTMRGFVDLTPTP